jgi:hypothetical protein
MIKIKTLLGAGTLAMSLAFGTVQAEALRWGAQNDILTLDPHSQNHATTNAILMHTYEGLTRYNKKYEVEPSLATSWQQLSPTQWRFNLRKGVTFHDGSPFTADDVVFSFDRIRQPQGTMQIYVTGIREVRKVDDHTVDLILDAPQPILLRNIIDFRIMSRAWAQKNNSLKVQDYKAREDTFARHRALHHQRLVARPAHRDVEQREVVGQEGRQRHAGDLHAGACRCDAGRGAALRRDRHGHRPAHAGRQPPEAEPEPEGGRGPRGAHHLHRDGSALQRAQVQQRQGS